MRNYIRVLWAMFVTTLFDFENLFSNEQAVTASAASTNIVDLGAENQRHGSKRTVIFAVTEDFATLTSLTLSLEHDSAEGMGTKATLIQGPAIAAADLVAGATFELPIPKGANQYIQAYYTVTGTNASAGKVTAGIVLDSEAQE